MIVEQEATYYAALELAAQIDYDCVFGVRHWRNKAGVLLNTLDAVVRAILDNDLLLPEDDWDTSFANSPPLLERLSDEALEDYRAGRTEPMELAA